MQTEVLLFFLALTAWLIAVSFLVYRVYALFNKLTKGVETTDLKKVLEKVISKEEENTIKISEMVRRVKGLEDEGLSHVQKVGLVRFNPFKELGGDHSFCLAILNGKESGVIITSLHTRDRTRVYMKDVVMGKSSHDLSQEEKRALTLAQKNR